MDPDTSSLRIKRAVWAALVGNGIIALMKFIIAIFTNSSALLAEGFHSVADTGNQAFLLLGFKLSARPPDSGHPFGYGKERYFWPFIVAISMFTIGAVLSINEGISKILNPQPLKNAGLGYLILGLSVLFESYPLYLAFQALKKTIKKRGIIRALRESKTPSIFIVLFEDSAAIFGISIAFFGIFAASLTRNSIYDGVASILIGVTLAIVALFLSYETKSLLIGEGVSDEDFDTIKKVIVTVPEVSEVIDILTMHLGPEDILVNLNINFVDNLTTDEVEEAIDKVERAIQEELPTVKRIFVEAESIRRVPKRR